MAKTHLSLPGEATGGRDTAAVERDDAPVNGYLEGPFAPVRQEMTIYDLQVTGTIPPELNGRFLRVGSNANPFDPENPRTYNWFIGSGMIAGVRLRQGKALWYRNRFVRDDKISKSLGLPRLPGPEVISRKAPWSEQKGPAVRRGQRLADARLRRQRPHLLLRRGRRAADRGQLRTGIGRPLRLRRDAWWLVDGAPAP